jgi:hypothetical protein
MTQDEIIAMLRASCDKDKVDPEQNGFWVIHTPELEAFAKLVAQHEREACAKVCESIDMEAFGVLPVRTVMITSHCAEAIRARGQA